MTRVSSLILLSAAAIALASPAFAKASIQKGETLCKAEIAKSEPAYKSVRVDKSTVRASNAFLVFAVKVRSADDSAGKLVCTVDRESQAVTVAPFVE